MILFDDEHKFVNTIAKLEEIYEETENGGIETTGMDGIIWVFNQFNVDMNLCDNFGSSIYIRDEKEFITKIDSNIYYLKSKSVYESWLMMLRNLNETIDELFRYGANETSKDVIFLNNILIFLSYARIYVDINTWKKGSRD